MNSTILMYVCLAGLGVLVPMLFVLCCAKRIARMLEPILARYRRLPLVVKIPLTAFVLTLIVHGSTKIPTNDVPGSGSAPTNSPAPMMAMGPRRSSRPQFTSGFASNELAVGYAVWRVGTNENWRFDAPEGATVAERWRIRGAAEDWMRFGSATNGYDVTTDGRVVTSNLVFSTLGLGLGFGIVPEANWGLLDAACRPSIVWTDATPWESWRVTWQNVLLGRETNTPVSVQMEMTREGDVIYEYDLRRAGETITNAVARIGEVGVMLETNTTSVLFYKLRPEDLVDGDRDEDDLSTWEEVNLYHTDPGLVDSDGDGLLDGDEVANGTDPTTRSVPNEEIVARINGSATNENYQFVWTAGADGRGLKAIKLWDGFAADWPEGATNLVFERTLNLGQYSGWQSYYLSSKPEAAGDWDLRGLVLEWDAGRGTTGELFASPVGDSVELPLTNGVVTIRLRAISPKIRSPKPLFLVGYTPTVTIEGGTCIEDYGSDSCAYVLADAATASLSVSIDSSERPCHAPVSEEDVRLPGLDDLAEMTGGALIWEGTIAGGVIRVTRPGCYPLPKIAVDDPFTQCPRPRLLGGHIVRAGQWIVALDPSVTYGGDHIFSPTSLRWGETNGAYSVVYEYPLNSKCLWRGWWTGADGEWSCHCEPKVTAGFDSENYDFIECGTEIDGDEAEGWIDIFGTRVWTGTAKHAWRDLGGNSGFGGSELLSTMDECGDCEETCANGHCDLQDGATLNSLAFRLSLGSPRKGQHSGFLAFESEGPVAVTPNLFALTAREDAWISERQENGCRVFSCSENRGRTITVESITDGVRLTVRTTADDTLEDIWEITNVNGATNRIRIREISRLNNVMRDETYQLDGDEWSRTDNIKGICETLERVDRLNDPTDGKLYETRTIVDATGLQLSQIQKESSRIGTFGKAVLRETFWQEDTGSEIHWRRAAYWDDPAHPMRHGQVKLVWGNCLGWEYHDYDTDGREVLRVEQRNGSAVPTAFPEVVAGDLYYIQGLADAFATVYDYTPFGNDSRHADENEKPRCETRYVVRNGAATRIGRTWHAYTHETVSVGYYESYPVVKEETWRAANRLSSRTDAGNAYSYVKTFSETAEDVPLVLRGEVCEELDEDGTLTQIGYGCFADGIEKWISRYSGGEYCPTEEYYLLDYDYGNVLEKSVRTTYGGETIEQEIYSYDEKNRLRSTTYLDGSVATNAYSCCRLLWTQDRDGARVLRSAVTGEDDLYYAEEEVGLRDVSSEGLHKVTQHFMDGLGRETNTVVYVAETAGEAMDWTASNGRRIRETKVYYPRGGDDYTIEIDVRGKVTERSRSESAVSSEWTESVYADESADTPTLVTRRVSVRGGESRTEKSWDGKWTREIVRTDYDVNGCAVTTEVTESSDLGTVTNRIVEADFLGRTTRETTPRGTTVTAYHGSGGRVNTTIFTSGEVTRTTTELYNTRGELIGNQRDGVSSTSEVTYEWEDGALWKVRRETVEGSVVASETERRERLTDLGDGLRRETVEIAANGVRTVMRETFDETTNEQTAVISNEVDGVSAQVVKYGRILRVTAPDGIAETTYDALGQEIGMTRGQQHLEYGYDAAGDLVEVRTFTNDVDFTTEYYGYDTFGRRIAVTNALGAVSTTAYDAMGNVVETSGATYPVRYTYDTAGRRTLLSTTRNGTMWDMTTWTYDPATGDKLSKHYPDGSATAYTHTPDGLEETTTLASQAGRTCRYNARRQLVCVESTDGRQDAAFAYDEFGRMIAASNSVARYAYGRARNGVVTNEVAEVGGDVRMLVRSLDDFGRIVSRGIAGEVGETIVYDAANRIAAISNEEAVVTYFYGEGGMDLGYELRLAGGTAIRREVVRDAYRPERIVAVSNYVNGVVVNGFEFAHDALGCVISRTEGTNTVSFAYDPKGQVVSAADQAFAYDEIGNIAGFEVLIYSVDGGVTELDGRSFTYDSAMHLASVSTGEVMIAAYDYDAFERRVRKVTDEATTTYLYDGWNLVRETIAATNGTSETIIYHWGKDISGSLDTTGGIGGLLYARCGREIAVPLYDANGNVVAYVDANGTTVAEFDYDAFGRVSAHETSAAFVPRFRFSTKYEDHETGLLYYGYRYYAPTAARWLTRDPLEEDGGVNLYTFCKNDGINKYDVLGMFAPWDEYIETERNFWRNIAEFYFRRRKNCPLSAMLLELSMCDLGLDAIVNFTEDTDLAKALKNSHEYKEAMNKEFEKMPYGYSFQNTSTSVNFTSGDLFTAVGHATISYNGEVCKRRNRTAKTNMRVTVKDRYDFDFWAWKWVQRPIVGTGVNSAWLDQEMGVIVPYRWNAIFDEKGEWSW